MYNVVVISYRISQIILFEPKRNWNFHKISFDMRTPEVKGISEKK